MKEEISNFIEYLRKKDFDTSPDDRIKLHGLYCKYIKVVNLPCLCEASKPIFESYLKELNELANGK